MQRNIRTYFVFVMIFIMALSAQVYAFFDDFERNKPGDDWQKSPTGDAAAWSIEKGEFVFSGAGGDSQMMVGEQAWLDYTVECDIKFITPSDYPGGVRTYVDLDTGGHYAVWFYPTERIALYSGTDWDINPGIVTLGEHKPFNPKLKVFYHVKMIHQGKHIEVWFGDNEDKMEKIIEADDDTFKKGLFGFDGYNQPIQFDNFRINGPGIPLSPGEAAVHNQNKLAIVWGKLKIQ